MKHLLFTVPLMLAAVSTNCLAQNRGNEMLKPFIGKVSYENFQKTVPAGFSQEVFGNNPMKVESLEQNGPQKAILFDGDDNEVKFRAFSLYDTRIRSVAAMVKFSSKAPTDYSLVYDFQAQGEGYKYVGAAAYVNDKVYAYTMSSHPAAAGIFMPPFELSEINMETGEITKLADMGRNVIADLAYDPETKCLYGSSYDVMQSPVISAIYKINPETPDKVEEIANLSGELIYTMSVDNGYLYAITRSNNDADTKLVRVKISEIKDGNVKFEEIKDGIGIKAMPAYQDMEIDKTTHRMFWWAQVDNGNGKTGHSEMIELNPKTGEIISKVTIPTDAQLTGLCTPYQVAADKAPGMVGEFKVSIDGSNAANAVIEWTNPSKDYQNKDLTSITGIEIFRNGESIAKVTENLSLGAKCTYKDQNVKTGEYVYRVQPINAEGPGIYREKSIYVGNDVPAAPTNVVLKASDTKGTLTWEAPTKGLHDGTMDKSTLKYDVVRYPGEVKVATDLTATTFNDEVEELNGYYYEVIAKNKEGVGGKAKSNTCSFGGIGAIPFINSLRTQEEFGLWTVVDNNNDNVTWVFTSDNLTRYSYCLNEADDYLFTPELDFKAGKQYQVRYSYNDAHWVEEGTKNPVNERLAVYYVPELDIENEKVRIASHDAIHNLNSYPVSEKQVFTAKQDGGFLAFQCWSERDRGILSLMDISVREYSDKDVSVININGSSTANVNAEQKININVGNEGKAPISNYKVVLYNQATKDVISEVPGVEIAAGATVPVAVTWVPKEVGKITLAARVELEGDTYPADNECKEGLLVDVAAEGADQFFTVNKDNNYGWAYPFYLNYKYNQNQCIYLDKEMSMKDIVLTGVQFVYDNLEEQVFMETKVRISIMSTEKNYFPYDDQYNVYLVKEGDWQVVYEGNISIDESDDNVKLYIPFTSEYKYTSGNILVKYERLYDPENVLQEGPTWHYFNCGEEDEEMQSAAYRTNNGNEVETINDSKTVCAGFVPYTAFSYHKEGDSIEGVINMGTDGFSIVQTETSIRFNDVCENAEIFDITGANVATAQDVQEMNIEGLPSGIYVVRVLMNGVKASNKFIVK